ncbi:HlyD family secretion protein [Pseudoduganella aquatica]|uniref:HlyD family efflux transporter periplasmic adaptor subunit n=1 Tax=Pseudoduganella aquatica TaxID=2660641 RepID=A0A7X4HEV9_9BURK|nr:HlyD family efflux transporter periplasmic adaptor subunit [Pseudoduganella aquatica]MYN09931.1 HlyD family efflux transporter periplasmic adaptor subunit [Pseudoduganella aquatica]
MNSLFRDQAIHHKSHRLHGAVILARTWSYPALTLFFCCLIAAIVIFALYFGFSRKETVSGMLVPERGSVRLATPQAGVISRLYVGEGQAVRVGDPLYLLSSERTSASGATQAAINQSLQARIAHLRQELEQQGRQRGNKGEELAQRLASLDASLRQIDGELALRRQKVQIMREVSSNVADLARDGAVSRNAASDKAAELMEQQARIAALEGSRLATQRELVALAASRADLPLQSGREASQLQRDIEALKQAASESEAQRELLVRAGQPGRVAAIVLDQGQAVAADQRVASLLPQDSVLEAELYVPTRAAGFIRPGTEVLLRYDAFPYQKFGQYTGRVRQISQATAPFGELQRAAGYAATGAGAAGAAALGAAEPVYRIRVRLDAQQITAAGQRRPLMPGMQLGATLVLEHRTLAEWALEPLLGMRGRL